MGRPIGLGATTGAADTLPGTELPDAYPNDRSLIFLKKICEKKEKKMKKQIEKERCQKDLKCQNNPMNHEWQSLA